ncbi:MAG: 1,4-dihydroxy-2-naphthoate octaprenyltransferase [Parachlamydiaceae bacterium]|nr:1,4-dihydroxy-2-naphthoate octaprenyltransferase [Parachlamydiaceae bacterium]
MTYSSRKGLQQVKIWIQASRPRTLTASVIPILLGTTLSRFFVESIDWAIAILTLICGVLIQIGINITNDALDFQRGTDNEQRLGFKRVTYLGLLAPKHVLMGGFICFALAFLCGIPLILHGGWPFLVVLLSSIIFGYLYTGGPYPLAYYGLGDFFTLIFFGVICTTAPFYLQTGFIDFQSILAGLQVGCLATALIATNNLRDIENDEDSGKRTLAVFFGKTFARIEITIMTVIPLLLGSLWSNYGYPYAAWLPFFIVPLVIKNLISIWKEEPSRRFNIFFIRCALTHLLFGILLTLGFLID